MIGKECGEIRSALAELTGTRWISVKFHKNRPRGIKLFAPASFCAAAAWQRSQAGVA